MRISERKRQLRERAGDAVLETGGVPVRQKPVARPKAARPQRVVAPSSARSAQRTAPARPVRQRGPRFFYAFGFAGIFFAVILAQATYSKYNSDLTAYHQAQAAYPAALSKYRAALATYKAAVANHTGAHLAQPKLPAVPHAPEISLASFSLPILYLGLSVAYIYLGYRAAKRRQATVAQER